MEYSFRFDEIDATFYATGKNVREAARSLLDDAGADRTVLCGDCRYRGDRANGKISGPATISGKRVTAFIAERVS